MLERLSRGPAALSELAQPPAMSLPAVVRRLRVQETNRLIRTEEVGRAARLPH